MGGRTSTRLAARPDVPGEQNLLSDFRYHDGGEAFLSSSVSLPLEGFVCLLSSVVVSVCVCRRAAETGFAGVFVVDFVGGLVRFGGVQAWLVVSGIYLDAWAMTQMPVGRREGRGGAVRISVGSVLQAGARRNLTSPPFWLGV